MTGFKELEVKRVIATIKIWAKQQPKICAVALVGSWAKAKNQAHENSDIDLMFLTPRPELFFSDTVWFHSIPWDLNLNVDRYYDRTYGVVKSRHLYFSQGQRIEFSFGYLNWANTDPIDPGTLKVVGSGMEIIYDRDQLLMALKEKAMQP